MVFTIHHGVTLHTGFAVQEVDRKFTQQVNKVLGMVAGKTQVVRLMPHTDEASGTVSGQGDLTLSPGIGDPGVAGISTGVTHIGEVGDKESLGNPAGWSISWYNAPFAS